MDLLDYNPSWAPNGEQAGIQVESAVVYPSSDIDTGYHWAESTYDADQFAQVVVSASASALFIGPAVRLNTIGVPTYYGYYASSTARYLVKSVDGVITQLGATTAAGVVASDILRLEVIGNKLTPFLNGTKDTLVGSSTDTDILSGNAGLAALGVGSGTSLSSWESGMIGSAPINYSEFAGAPFGAPEVQMEGLTQINGVAPDAIAASTNLTGVVAAVQDDPDAPDGTWLTATSAVAATDLRVTFPAMQGPLTPAAAQNFRYLVRKTAGTPTPTVTAELRESNVLRKTFATDTPITSTSGTVIQGDFTDADVVDTSGANVELRLVSSPGLGSAQLVHFSKLDGTTRTTTSLTAVELPNYTVTWANLTAAGFVAGDNALIIVGVKHWGSSANGNYSFAVGFGTTFAGRTEDATSIQRAEAPGTAAGPQYLWLKRRALVVNENIYFRGMGTVGTSSYDEFVCFILNYDDIPASDKLYAEATHSGNAPTAYNTSGAGAATPSAGDWWIVASSRWLVDGVAEDMFLAINDGTADVGEVSIESEDAADEMVIGTMTYRPALGSGVTVRARYKETGATAPPDIASTSIFGLRLDTFADHWGVRTTNTITHSVIDTYQTFASNGIYNLNNTGPFVVFGWPIHSTTDAAKRPYGRIRINAADWLTTTTNRSAAMDNGAAQRIAPLLFGYNPAQDFAILNLELQIAEDVDIAPTYTCPEQVAVAFSLFMQGGGANTVEYGAIKWNASVEIPFTDQRPVNADAAVLKPAISATVSANVVVAIPVTRTTNADAAVLKQQISASTNVAVAVLKLLQAGTSADVAVALVSRTVSLSADVGVALARTAALSANAGIAATTSGTTNASPVVAVGRTVATTADAVVLGARTATTGNDAAVLTTISGATSADAAVRSAKSVQPTADVSVALVRSASASASLGVAVATTITTGAAPAVAINPAISTNADVAVLESLAASTGHDAAVLKTFSETTSADGVVLVALSSQPTADAAVLLLRSSQPLADVAVAFGGVAVTQNDTAVLDTRSLEVGADTFLLSMTAGQVLTTAGAAVLTTLASEIIADIAVIRSRSIAASLSAVAAVGGQAVPTANAAILASRTASTLADAWVASLNAQSITADVVASETFFATVGADVGVIEAGVAQTAITADAAVLAMQALTSTADAAVLVLNSSALTADAVAIETLSATVAADTSVIPAPVTQIAVPADTAVLALDMARTVSADAYVGVYVPFVAIPGDGCTLQRLPELRVVTTPASIRTLTNPAILRSVTAPAIIIPEAP